MSLPLCPVCQNNYNTSLVPRVMHPCGHGICSQCLDKYVSRGGDTCPICRTDILHTCCNYDLLSMCKPPEDDWKMDIRRILGRVMPDRQVDLHVGLKQVAPLIRLRCEWTVGSLKEAKCVLVKLMADMPVNDVLEWVSLLSFDDDIELQLVEHVSKLVDQRLFLQNDGWVLELVHSV